MAFRSATAADIPAIVDLWSELTAFHADRDPAFVPAPDGREHFASFITQQIERPNVLFLVAQRGDTSVGYCQAAITSRPAIFADRARCAILDLAVTSAHRRDGIGVLLISEVERWAQQQRVGRVQVCVACTNDLALSFYAKQGFSADTQHMSKEIEIPNQ